jgi:hypothetical protein
MPRHLHLLLLLALFFCFGPTAHAQSCTPPPSGMVGWWPGDGNSNDIIGGNNGTLFGGVSFGPGEVGQAFSFDGSTGYVNAFDTGNLDFTGPLTLNAWIKLTTLSYQYIVSKPTTLCSGALSNYQLLISSPPGNVDFALGDGTNVYELFSNTPLSVGIWYHIAAVYDGNNMIIYINGAQDAVLTIGPKTLYTNPGEPVVIGAANSCSFYGLTGFIDEVQIFDHALVASEIQAIYNAGIAGTCKSLSELSVSARMDIYRAGGYNDLSDGVGPAVYTIQAGTVPTITFSGITGAWACAPSAPLYSPDGTTGPGCVAPAGGLNINPIGPFSGYASTDFGGALTGVFLSDSLSTSAPPSLRFYMNDSSKGGIQTNFTSLSPLIGQVFFVGDGLTGTGAGSPQVFQVPPTATHLYLGYLDSCNGTSPAPSCFNTNKGSVSPTVSASCGFSISPTSAPFGAAGGSGEIVVTTLLPPSSCPFSVTAGASWIHPQAKLCPRGGVIPCAPFSPPLASYSVDRNTTPSQRTGTLTVAGQMVTITQSAAGTCTYSINPTGQTFSENAGRGSVAVASQAGCSWSAVVSESCGYGKTAVACFSIPPASTWKYASR